MRFLPFVSSLLAIGVIATSGVWIYQYRYQYLQQPPPSSGAVQVKNVEIDGNNASSFRVAFEAASKSPSQVIPGVSNSKKALIPFPWSNGAIMEGLATFKDPGVKAESEQNQTVQRLLAEKDFTGLDALAKKLRSNKIRFASGKWCIFSYYDTVASPLGTTADGWSKHDALLTNWCKASPKSVTALIARAEFLTSYAWQARGSGWANTVSPEGWQLFNQRLMNATELLAKARQFAEKDPHLWFIAQRAALGLGTARESYEKLFQEAVELEPNYYHYYEAKAQYLLPRWHGKPGEWETFAEESAKSSPLGLEVYARIVSSLKSYHKNVFAESTASWEKTNNGFDLIRKRFPSSTRIVRDYVQLCQTAKDPAPANVLLRELDFRLDAKLWPDVDTLTAIYAWATEPGTGTGSPQASPEPLANISSKPYNGKAISSELDAWYTRLEIQRRFLDLTNVKAVAGFKRDAAAYQAALNKARNTARK